MRPVRAELIYACVFVQRGAYLKVLSTLKIGKIYTARIM